ncbi:hybrid sensor histidine kinase/response regulator [Gimesia fumaroli]|uniref:histidine kinase n=1 Tax=Gimesia fumaroli TaxID=2527976 RepID=A0A518I9C1_9PLAN|nr:hybrid sensor histidine kinase/response regulator [Gimesia fumaroli]QDV49654.1 Phytochrome-like protein cph1 [Gimesia fumaroli]
MNNEKLREKFDILLIEENPTHATLIIDLLNTVNKIKNSVITHVKSVTDALNSLKARTFSVLVLTLDSSETHAIESLSQILAESPVTPVITLATKDDDALSSKIIQTGAQDYLIKAELTGPILYRTIRHAVERKKQLTSLTLHNENLQAFARAASHDLKAPLGNIKTISQIVLEEAGTCLENPVLEMLRSLPLIANRLKKLIDDMLRFSLLGQKSLQRDHISLRSSIKIACEFLEEPMRNQNATINIGHLDDVYADVALMTTVFQNLLGNACKYVKDVAPVISINTKIEGRFVVAMVQDNGIGIPKKERQRIFEPLTRAVNASDYEGTGLGLSIVKRIIEAHQGQIWVESMPGKGSTFFFSIPQANSQSAS